MFLVVALVRKGIVGQGLGESMYSAQLMTEALPTAVELNEDDSLTTREMKELILRMTSYNATDRPSSTSVLRDVTSTNNKVTFRPPCIYGCQTDSSAKFSSIILQEVKSTCQ